MDIWQERALADSLDTPDMEQPDFAWPTNLEEESHPNQVSLQEEVSWNNNPQMLDQLFHGSLQEEEQQPQVEEMQLVEQLEQVHQQPKLEVEEMRWISPAEAEGIVQPKKEGGRSTRLKLTTKTTSSFSILSNRTWSRTPFRRTGLTSAPCPWRTHSPLETKSLLSPQPLPQPLPSLS